MNRERIQAAIELMKRARNLNMITWQTKRSPISPPAGTVSELHACGNSACFGGYLALSPEWKEAGGTVTIKGGPVMSGGFRGAAAVAEYLGISERQAESLVFGDLDGTEEEWSNFYDKFWRRVTPQDVIAKLEQLLEMEAKNVVA